VPQNEKSKGVKLGDRDGHGMEHGGQYIREVNIFEGFQLLDQRFTK